jgi:hypothetical protein
VPITVITGPPGAGKTTIAAALARASPLGVHLIADECFHWIAPGYVSPWLSGADNQNRTVIEVVGLAAARYEVGGYEVVVDGIVGPWFLPHFQAVIGPAVERLRYVVLRPIREVALRRAVGRRAKDDLVDPGPVNAMYDVFEDLGSFQSHVIDSSAQDPPLTLGAVMSGLDDGTFNLSELDRDDIARSNRQFDVD